VAANTGPPSLNRCMRYLRQAQLHDHQVVQNRPDQQEVTVGHSLCLTFPPGHVSHLTGPRCLGTLDPLACGHGKLSLVDLLHPSSLVMRNLWHCKSACVNGDNKVSPGYLALKLFQMFPSDGQKGADKPYIFVLFCSSDNNQLRSLLSERGNLNISHVSVSISKKA
jgi:hypothetical protein